MSGFEKFRVNAFVCLFKRGEIQQNILKRAVELIIKAKIATKVVIEGNKVLWKIFEGAKLSSKVKANWSKGELYMSFSLIMSCAVCCKSG